MSTNMPPNNNAVPLDATGTTVLVGSIVSYPSDANSEQAATLTGVVARIWKLHGNFARVEITPDVAGAQQERWSDTVTVTG